jgi:hypothetical protein
VLPAGIKADDAAPTWSGSQGSCDATLNWQVDQPEHRLLHGTIDHSGFLVLRLRSYPAWRITSNGSLISSLPHRDDGLIAVPVSQGNVELTLDWITTPDVVAGRCLSALAVLLLIGLGYLEQKHTRPQL